MGFSVTGWGFEAGHVDAGWTELNAGNHKKERILTGSKSMNSTHAFCYTCWNRAVIAQKQIKLKICKKIKK